MTSKIHFKLIVLIFLIAIYSSPTEAFYKKKVLVGEFQNPVDWDMSYHPGNIIADLLRKELILQKRVQLITIPDKTARLMKDPKLASDQNYVEPTILESNKISFSEKESIQSTKNQIKESKEEVLIKKMEEHSLWPAKMGVKPNKPNFTKIIGKIIKFSPDDQSSHTTGSLSLKSGNRQKVLIQINIELLQNSTGRSLYEKTFEIYYNSENKDFNIENLDSKYLNSESSSMKIALNSLKIQIGSFIHEKIDSLPLEGEIISVNKKEFFNINDQEEILVNIGSLNGVKNGDLFQVDAIGLQLNDLHTARKLGDIYVKIGVIKILQVWEGTAIAISFAGKNFETGLHVRSYSHSRKGQTNFHNRPTKQEKLPWWDFHGTPSIN